MPCDTVSSAKVKFGQETSLPTLNAAIAKLKADGVVYNVGIARQPDGSLNVFLVSRESGVSQDTLQFALKREYSRQTVMTQAKRFGWSVKEQPDGKLVVQKASF